MCGFFGLDEPPAEPAVGGEGEAAQVRCLYCPSDLVVCKDAYEDPLFPDEEMFRFECYTYLEMSLSGVDLGFSR